MFIQGIIMSSISVLMSIYNESETYMAEAIQSILNQTLSDIEIIIVNDNPQRKEIKGFVSSFNDGRIVFIQNENNLGLALSMNKAAEYATARYLARMDADDIAEPERLEKEYALIETGQYDLIFSGYSYIDKDSRPCGEMQLPTISSEKELIKQILTKSIIHHPTVMMTKEIFNRVEGYRDFPCAQDIDLWQRMYYSGCRFCMIPHDLLKYRINPNSVSATKWYQQQLTIFYINRLFLERIRNGKDSYSKTTYESYLLRSRYTDNSASEELKKAVLFLKKAKRYAKKNRRLQSIMYRAKAFCMSSCLRNNFITKMRILQLLELS